MLALKLLKKVSAYYHWEWSQELMEVLSEKDIPNRLMLALKLLKKVNAY